MFYNAEIQSLNLYIEYEYLRARDVEKILKSLSSLHENVLRTVDKYQIKDPNTGEKLIFSLTINEVNTGSSIKFNFSGIFEKVTSLYGTFHSGFRSVHINKKNTKKLDINVSIELKDVITILLIMGALNCPNKEINRSVGDQEEKVQKINERVQDNNIWNTLKDSTAESYINIENDMGIEGIRRAKKDYDPSYLKKFIIANIP